MYECIVARLHDLLYASIDANATLHQLFSDGF